MLFAASSIVRAVKPLALGMSGIGARRSLPLHRYLVRSTTTHNGHPINRSGGRCVFGSFLRDSDNEWASGLPPLMRPCHCVAAPASGGHLWANIFLFDVQTIA